MREYLDLIMEWSGAREDWRPVSRWTVVAWLVFYVFFLIYYLFQFRVNFMSFQPLPQFLLFVHIIFLWLNLSHHLNLYNYKLILLPVLYLY